MNSAILPQHIDSTMMTAFRSCPQKFFLEFCYGFRPQQPSIDLHAGACFASALEEFYKQTWLHNRSHDESLTRAFAKFSVEWGDFVIPEYKKTNKTFERTWAAVEAYLQKWPPKTDHVQPYFLGENPTFEYTFAIPLEPAIDPKDERKNWQESFCFPLHPSGDPFLYSGRFDMLGSYCGKPCVRDEKTTGSSISSGWADKWNLRAQFMGYVWACQQQGLESLETVVVRGVAIQKTQTPLEEAIKTFNRFLVSRWLEQTRRDLWRMRLAWDAKYFDFNFGDSCTSFNNCMFMDVCSSPNFESWTSDFIINRWNPLEKNPVAESEAA